MELEREPEIEIDGLGKIFYAEEPFNEGLEYLKEVGATPISSKELALARLLIDKNPGRELRVKFKGLPGEVRISLQHPFTKYGSFVREGVLMIPHSEYSAFLIRESPLLDSKLAKLATEAHVRGEVFEPNKKIIEKYLDLAASGDKSVFPVRGLKEGRFGTIPTERFGSDDLTTWLFGEHADSYGSMLKDIGFTEVYSDSSEEVKEIFNKKNKPRLNQLHIGPLFGCLSTSVSRIAYLDYLHREGLRGIILH